MGGVFVIVIIIGAIVIGISMAKSRNEALNQSWGRVARHLGLSLRPVAWNTMPRLDGKVEGRPLVVDVHKKGSGKSSSIWTRFVLGMPALGFGLEIKEQGFLAKVAKALGGQDIEIGDRTFDDSFSIKGTDAAAIRAFLTPERRRAIRDFFAAHPGTIITDREIAWSKRGRVSDAGQLLDSVRSMLDVAGALGSPVPQPLAPAATAGIAAASILAAAPMRAAAPEPAAERTAPEPAAARTAEREAIVEPAAGEPAGVDGPGAAEFCDTVFASGALSFEATRRFDGRFKGRTVAWSGTLESAVPYAFDFVFGPGGGVKASVVIHSMATQAYGDGTVRAVVQLPRATDGLDGRVGRTVRFSGKLVKVDGLMRKVFVSEAALR